MDWLHELYVELSRIEGYLYTIVHPNLILARLLDDSVGLLLNVWFKFILSTTDFETGGDFVNAAVIQRFEPKVQVVADAALVLIALWASYRIMWGHGLFTQYTAGIMHNANEGTWEVITTGALAAGYGVLAIAYLVRYAVLIVLAITAPFAGL